MEEEVGVEEEHGSRKGEGGGRGPLVFYPCHIAA